jgi:hypothetical protein
MESNTESISITTLKLNNNEALWLKRLCQNPMCDLSDESPENNYIRSKFWESLPPLQHLEDIRFSRTDEDTHKPKTHIKETPNE